MMQITPMVKQLLIINIIVYLGANFLAPAVSYEVLALHFPLNEKFGWWQIITHMFMHAEAPNFMHIAFNMFGLFMFGSNLEHYWGGKKFLIFYLSCGIGASLLYLGINYMQYMSIYNDLIGQGATATDIKAFFQTGGINNVSISQSAINSFYQIYHTPAVGASGALYGILVAFAFMFPNVELMLLFIPVPIKAKYFVPVIVLFDLFAGLNGNSVFGYTTGIAHFAHFGGALTGFLLMLYFKKKQFDKNRWD